MIHLKKDEPLIVVLGKTQELLYIQHNKIQARFMISTAKNGFGEQKDSYCTPRGWHYIRAVIGENQDKRTHFQSRRPTKNPSDICGRILWLSGLEKGVNRGDSVDSMQRYIYIHGTPQKINHTPDSRGCINMQIDDIIKLYHLNPLYCKVLIIDQ